jgi:hypothetical protein
MYTCEHFAHGKYWTDATFIHLPRHYFQLLIGILDQLGEPISTNMRELHTPIYIAATTICHSNSTRRA